MGFKASLKLSQGFRPTDRRTDGQTDRQINRQDITFSIKVVEIDIKSARVKSRPGHTKFF